MRYSLRRLVVLVTVVTAMLGLASYCEWSRATALPLSLVGVVAGDYWFASVLASVEPLVSRRYALALVVHLLGGCVIGFCVAIAVIGALTGESGPSRLSWNLVANWAAVGALAAGLFFVVDQSNLRRHCVQRTDLDASDTNDYNAAGDRKPSQRP